MCHIIWNLVKSAAFYHLKNTKLENLIILQADEEEEFCRGLLKHSQLYSLIGQI